MANSKKLRKAAAKFRRTEPVMHAICSRVIDSMAMFIRKTGAAEVTAEVVDGIIVDIYANEQHKTTSTKL